MGPATFQRVVLPDAAHGPERERHRTTASVLTILAALGLIAGFLAFGALTRPLPVPGTLVEANPRTEPDTWHLVRTIPATVPYALVVDEGRVLVFTSTPDPDAAAPTGLQVWQSSDGLAWEPMGTVIEPGFAVDSVSSTSLGLVAFGLDESEKSHRVWLSADGLRWLPLLDGLPVESLEISTTADNVTSSDLARAIGNDATVVQYEQTERRDVALVSRPPDFSHPFSVETFEIWTTSQ